MVVGDLHGNIPAFRQVLIVRPRPAAAAAPGPPGADPRAPALPGRRRRQVASAGRRRLRPEVPVPRPGPPDPRQPRAIRADRPADRQVGRAAQRPLPRRDQHRLRGSGDGGVRGLPRPLRRAPAGRPDAEPGLPLPHDARPDRPGDFDPAIFALDDLARPSQGPPRRGLRDHLGPEHRPRDRRPLRPARRRRPGSSPATSPATTASARPTTASSSSTAPTPIPPPAASPPGGRSRWRALLARDQRVWGSGLID